MMLTAFYFARFLQFLGLVTVLSALLWGLNGGGMYEELLLLAGGAAVFYAGHAMQGKAKGG